MDKSVSYIYAVNDYIYIKNQRIYESIIKNGNQFQ